MTDALRNSAGEHNISLGMKKYLLALFALLFLAPMVPNAGAQVVIAVGHRRHYRHYRHYHHYYHHHHYYRHP